MNEEQVNYLRRTYRLKTKDGKYAWIYDESGEIAKGGLFDTKQDALDWHDKNVSKTFVRFETK